MKGGRLGARLLVGALLVAGLLVALGAAPARGHGMCTPGGAAPSILVPPPPDDWDCDFVKDVVDNCPPLGYDDLRHRNPNQLNSDENLPGGDALGDWCDADDDADGVPDWTDGQVDYFPNRVKWDNCRIIPNPPPQTDTNGNGVGDACEFDNDHDGAFDSEDNCRYTANPDQSDMDGDRVGDACDNDLDGDFVRNGSDNCPLIANPQVAPDWIQPDADNDRIGTACDPDESTPTPSPTATPGPTPTPTVPGSPGGGGGGGGGPTADVNDRQAPRVTLRLKSTQHRDEIEDGLVVRVSCSEACTAKAELVADKKLVKKLKLRGTSVASATAKVEAAASTYAFVRLDARTRRALFKQKRTTLTLKVAVTDPSGNTRRVSQRLTLTR